jgi:4-hydroxy-4-methyl-2-oxoglutarate aldolase
VRERFTRIYTAALADVLDEHGFRRQTLPPEITALAPGMRLAGQAFTVEGRPADTQDWDAAVRKTLAMLGSVPAGHVAVYQCHHDVSAHFGELSATSLLARGVAGCVIDGGCRDVRFILDAGFPVFARFTTPEDSTWRWQVTATQVPVTIGRVQVDPKAATESAIRDAVREGMLPLDAYERYGTF